MGSFRGTHLPQSQGTLLPLMAALLGRGFTALSLPWAPYQLRGREEQASPPEIQALQGALFALPVR